MLLSITYLFNEHNTRSFWIAEQIREACGDSEVYNQDNNNITCKQLLLKKQNA